ncbi:MAG: LPS translocon maturation chaperone LptM [Betaproteobacteria bacterium]
MKADSSMSSCYDLTTMLRHSPRCRARIALVVALAATLASCGIKGPLRPPPKSEPGAATPPRNGEPATPPATTSPALPPPTSQPTPR